MLPEKIMQSSLLDILFENRNKTYGAYALRKSYNKRLVYAVTVTSLVVAAFAFTQMFHHSKHYDLVTTVIIPPDINLQKIDEVKPPLPVVAKPAATHFNQIISSPPVIVKDNMATTMPTVDDVTKSIIGPANIKGDDATDIIAPPAAIKQSITVPQQQSIIIKEDDKPLVNAEVMPEFPGGMAALQKFMLKNLRQPDNLQAGEKIIVRAMFVVDKDGKISQVKIIKNGRDDLDKEVTRVINKMPLWKPGLQNGKTVAVYFNLPVTFMSEEE